MSVKDEQTFKSIQSGVIKTIRQDWSVATNVDAAVLSAYNSYRLSRIERALNICSIKYCKNEPICPSVSVDELKTRYNELVRLYSSENTENLAEELQQTKEWLLEQKDYRAALIYIARTVNRSFFVPKELMRALKKHKSPLHLEIKHLLKKAGCVVHHEMQTKLGQFISLAHLLFKNDLMYAWEDTVSE